uniref:C-type lectin domain-containing protein n=1 Tax=Panagrolaimus davidi TaxID=227884 RepID=A0A914P4G0_9BILA
MFEVKNKIYHNKFLEQALVNFNDTTVTDFWIGANDLEFPSRWAWLDGTIFEFKDWDKGQPQNTSGTNCAAAIMKYGKWVADDCYTQKPYACMIQALTKTTHTKIASTTTSYVSKETTTLKSKTCGDWEYLDKTGFCYKFFGNSSTDHLTFWGAENKCQKFGGHLASIHSYGEAFLVGSIEIFFYYVLSKLF